MVTPASLFTRCPANPILTAATLPYPAHSVFNPAAARVNGETVLLLRVEDLRGISHLTVARSANGTDSWETDGQPSFRPAPERHPEEVWGVEDPRLTWVAELGVWIVAYTAFSRRGPLISLAQTADFHSFRRLGPALTPEDKDGALFPRRFGGRFALIHRPTPLRGGAHIWVSYSPDLHYWGDHHLLLEAREGAWWDAGKIGLGPPPLETPEGWLLMYHGVRHTAAGAIYRVGLALLDLEDPRTVLHRSDEWVFGPREPYELAGDIEQVVFPCGWILDESTGRIDLYYGAADTTVALATAQLGDLLDHLKSSPVPEPRRRHTDR